jgi:hypothetical protein
VQPSWLQLTSVSQRIRGAIDARIAEEQAKQRTTPATPPRSSSAQRRSGSRNLSPSKRSTKSKDGDSSKGAPAGKGPDPSEFVIGDEEDQPSRASTPRPKEKAHSGEGASEDGSEKKEDDKEAVADEKSDKTPDIPPEVQLRLRKLHKLEPKYTGK